MSIAENLRRKICDFQDIIGAGSFSASEVQGLKDIAESIRADWQHFNGAAESAYISELLFKDNENSLLNVLKSSLNKPELSDVVAICIEVFVLAVWHLDIQEIERYSGPLWNFAAKVSRNENLKSKREAGFDLLVAIMDKLKLSPKRDSMNVKDMTLWTWQQVDNINKLNSSIRKGIFLLMGALCKFYPECMLDNSGKKNYAATFATIMAGELKAQMDSKTKAPVYTSIEGCFTGISGLLCNFSDVFDPGVGRITLRQLYDYAKRAVNPSIEASRHGPKKAALELLTTHAALFTNFFYEEYALLYGYFRQLAVKQDRELKYAGLSAMEALIQQVSAALQKNVDVNRAEAETVYKHFVDAFRKELVLAKSTREVAMAAKGCGSFAVACKALYGSDQLGKMLVDLTGRCEEVFLMSSDPLEQKVTYISMFLEGFAMIFAAIEEVPSDVWLSMETLHILLFQHFPLLDPKYHQRAIAISYRLFFATLPFNERYVDTVVYQSLARLCSLSPPAFVNAEEEEEVTAQSSNGGDRDPKNMTYRSYLPLWRQLLNADSMRGWDNFGVDLTAKDVIAKNISDALFRAVVEMLERLDFSTIRKQTALPDANNDGPIEGEDAPVSSDPVTNVAPRKTTDICILVNLADFSRDLMTQLQITAFSEWIFSLSSRLMDLSTRFPLISGFYKMLALCLNVGTRMNLLEAGTASVNTQNSFELFSRYIDEVSIRMVQFKDDLYVSCLELILAIPPDMVVEKLKKGDILATVIKSSLKLGLSYLPLAEACLNALERWNTHDACADNLKLLYSKVLPDFDEYLRSEGAEENSNGTTAAATTKSGRKRATTKKDVTKQKARLKAISTSKQPDATRLNDLRIRMLLFIGKLGGEVNKYLLEQTAEEISKKCVTWDSNSRLEFSVPFLDMKPTIKFDDFLPRICELAVWCGNRQTKIAACELLHSIILLLLGKAASKRDVLPTAVAGDKEERNPFHKLYRHIFPVMLQLCCDADEVPKQLYRTLMSQSIHWFTSNKTSDNPETTALLEALLDGLVDQNANLRDYCADCLNEFLKWSIKHSAKDSSHMNSNFRNILKRLYSLAYHPASKKRLGAALAFNSIYRTFREEESFVDMYTFEIFAVYMNSLARSHGDDEGEEGGTIDQLNDITKHIDRIVKAKKGLLNKQSKDRKIPIGWARATLADCVSWLFDQIGRLQMQFRQRCFELLISWTPLVEGFGVFHNYVSQFIDKQGLAALFQLCENGGVIGDGVGGIRKSPKIDLDTCTFQTLRSWFDSIEAALDCYQAFFDQAIIDAKDLFDAKKSGGISLLTSLRFFLEKVVLFDRIDLAAYTPNERRNINRSKCNVVIRTFVFMETLFKAKVTDVPFLESFWRLLVRCCFNPSSVGFDMTVKETSLYLPKTLERVLTAVSSLTDSVSAGFTKQLKKDCGSVFEFPSVSLLLDERKANWISLNERLHGYEVTIRSSVLPDGYFPPGEKLWQDVNNLSFVERTDGSVSVRSWPPNALMAAKDILSTASRTTKDMEVVVSLLLDSTPVMSYKGANRLSTKGQLWLGIFRSQIAELVARHPSSFLATILEGGRFDEYVVADILAKVTDSIVRSKEIRSEFGPEYVKQFSTRCRRLFEKLSTGDDQSKLLSVSLLQKVLLIDTKFLSTTGEYLFDIFVNFLASKIGDMRFKNKVLMLLGPFAICGPDQSAKLKDALNTFIVRSFPFQSTEFEKGTREYDEYLTALRRMIFGLTVSNSTVILDALITVLSREKEHCAEAEIASLLGSYCRELPPSKYESIIVVPLNFFLGEDRQISDDHRLNCLSKFLLPMLNGFDDNMLSRFFLEKGLKPIMQLVESPWDRSNDAVYKSQLTVKLGCFRLLELMYNRLSVSVLKGQLNMKYCGGQTNDNAALVKKLVKLASDERNEGKRDGTLVDLKRAYRCAAHNLLIAVIAKTQTQMRFFDSYIFKDTWDTIIDENKVYEFEIELEVFPRRKQQQQLLIQQSWTNSLDQRLSGTPERRPLRFLSSTALSESSLRAEVSQYDFTGPSQSIGASLDADEERPRARMGQDSWSNSQNQSQTLSASISEPGSTGDDFSAMDLEADELNLHPCMEPMLNVIRTIVSKNLAPSIEGEMPHWMETLYSSMSAYGNPVNVKIFIARIITVVDEIFQPFAKHWVRPLISLCLNSALHQPGLNYFRVDIIAMLLRWSKASEAVRTVDGNLKSDLFQYCMTHSPSDNSQVFRRNLRLLNLMLEFWKDSVTVDPRLITDQLKKTDIENPPKIGIGVQMLGVVLANDLSPVGRDDAAAIEIYRTLAYCLSAKSAKTYKPAAEVIGLALKYLFQQDSDILYEVEQTAVSQIRGVLGHNRAKFLSCLQAIQRHYPKFSDDFLRDIISWLPSVHGEYKAYSLEIICYRAEKIPRLYNELKARGFMNFLVSGDERNQVWALKILCNIAENLSVLELAEVIPTLSSMVTHSSVDCRRAVADFFIRVYDTRGDVQAVVEMAKEALLMFLNDPEPALKLLIYNFWSHETRLSTNTSRRLMNILEKTYSNSTESEFLGHATYLLLELTSRSPDYKRPIFDTPLQDCRFEDLRVATSWKRRYATLQMPAFAESAVMSQQQHQSPTKATIGLRATVVGSPDFSQTVAATGASGELRAYDWRTGSTIDTFAGSTLGGSMDTDEGGGLLFAPRHRYQRPTGRPGEADRRRAVALGDAGERREIDENDELKRLRRRIVKDNRQTASEFFARMQSRRQQAREKLEEERKKAREQNVQLFRSYRQGDFPDIQIQHSAIIAPLQALAQQDPIVASLLLASLIDGVYLEVCRGDEEETAEVTSSLTSSIESILENSAKHYKPLLACLQTFCFRHVDKLKFDPELMSNVSSLGHQQRMAIVLLEKSLLYGGGDGEKEPKRRRIRAQSESDREAMPEELVSQWANLANLYKSLGDNDSVRVIYGQKIAAKPITIDALEAESAGDYQQAASLYAKALKENAKEEEDMSVLDAAEFSTWEESRLKCMNLLNKWTDLATVTARYIDDGEPPDLNKMWEDHNGQVDYIPFLLRAKLKLLSSSEEGNGVKFSDYMNAWRNDEEKRQWLETHHPDLLTLFTIVKREYGAAGHLCKKVLRKFLKDWTSLSVTDQFARQQCLQSLQVLVEMNDFVALVQRDGGVTSLIGLDRILRQWERQIPGISTDSTSAWNDVITNRALYAEQLCQDLKKRKLSEQDMYHCVFSSELRTSLLAVNNALHMRNYAVAFSILDASKDQFVNVIKEEEAALQWAHSYVGAQHVVANRSIAVPANAASRLSSAVALLERFRETATSKEMQAEHALLEGMTLEKIGWLCIEESKTKKWFSDLDSGSRRVLSNIGYESGDPQAAFAVLQKAYPFYQQAVKEKADITVGDHHLWKTDPHLTLAEYCDRILRSEFSESPGVESFPAVLTEHLLASMKNGCIRARVLFPQLIQIVEQYPDVSDIFIKNAADVPTWMFLSWLSQLTAVLSKPFAENFHNIIERVADTYPEALVYCFGISSDGYTFGNTSTDKKNKEFVAKIAKKMESIAGVKDFLRSLMLFLAPNAIVKDIKNNFGHIYSSKTTQDERKKSLEDFYRELFMLNYAENELGSYWKEFRAKFQQLFDSTFGENCAKLLEKDVTCPVAAKKVGEFENKIKNYCDPKALPRNLASYSVWLSQYDSQRLGIHLEIPGQYNGDEKPRLENHVRISGFDSDVMALVSIRLPRKITIRGDDGKDYAMLVKTGEDLRQDERIQRLLGQMNQIFLADAECRRMNALVRTYSVTPLSARIGIIEWVPNAQVFESFIKISNDSMTKASSCVIGHNKTVKRPQDPNKLANEFAKSFQGVPHRLAIECFLDAERQVPKYAMRNAIVRLCATPDGFYTLRSQFTSSYASLCITNYILGVGDRHLKNIMIDETTGSAVGIDFGHAFGSALGITVPELMPFRLTQQVRCVFEPVGVHGQAEGVMISCLRALRENRYALFNTMNVFVNEPSIDWLQEAKRHVLKSEGSSDQASTGSGSGSGSSSLEDYAPKRLEAAQRKLAGDNPVPIMETELKNVLGSRFYNHERVIEVMYGKRDGKPVSKQDRECPRGYPATGLSPEDQVRCLIDMAIDPLTLARTWCGWSPWV